jgi:hypothetical protein
MALTLKYASNTRCFEISNDFNPLVWFIPGTPVGHQADPDDPSPSLHPHYRASPLISGSLTLAFLTYT